MGIKSNNLAAIYHDFFSRSGKDAVNPYVAPVPYEASGGIISDYEVSGTHYRAHIFNSPGTFVSNGDASIDYLLVGGGGGGGFGRAADGGGGGGGAGALVYATNYSVSAQSYSVTVGTGGAAAANESEHGAQGGSSIFGPGPLAAIGGGGGGSTRQPGAYPAGGSTGGAGSDASPDSATSSSGASSGTNNSVSPPAGWGDCWYSIC